MRFNVYPSRSVICRVLIPLLFYFIHFSIAAQTSRQDEINARQTLISAKSMQKAGQYKDAVALLRTRFPNGVSDKDLAIVYFKIIGSEPEGRREALDGLEKLKVVNGKNLQVRLAYLWQLSQEDARRKEAISGLIALKQESGVDKQEVLKTWREIINSRPNNDPNLIGLCQQYLASDPGNVEIVSVLQRARSAEEERIAIATNPIFLERKKGLDFLENNRFAEAEKSFNEVLKQKPNDPLTVGSIGVIRLKQSRYMDAISYFKKAINADPENASKWNALIQTASYKEDIRRANKALVDGQIALARKISLEAISIDPTNADAYIVLGDIDIKDRQYALAEKRYRQALEYSIDSDGALQGLVKIYLDEKNFLKASRLLSQKEYSGKFTYLKIEVQNAETSYLMEIGDTDKAIISAKKALALDLTYPWTRFKLANLLSDKGFGSEGNALILEGVRLSPHDGEMVKAAVIYYRSRGQVELAHQIMEHYLGKQRNPSIDSLILSLRMLDELNLSDEYDKRYFRINALKLSSDQRRELEQVSLVHELKIAQASGKVDQAKSILERLIKIDPTDPWLRFDLANIYAAQSQFDRGLELFQGAGGGEGGSEFAYAKALYLSKNDSPKEAMRALESIPVANRTPSSTALQRRLWLNAHLKNIQSNYDLGNRREAIRDLSDLQEKFHGDPESLLVMAKAWASLEDANRASSLYISLLPSEDDANQAARLQYAEFLLNQKQYESFEKQLRILNGVKLNALDAKALSSLEHQGYLEEISLQIEKGDYDYAQLQLRKLSNTAKLDPKTLNLLSELQRRQGLLDQAILSEQESLTLQTPSIKVANSLTKLKIEPRQSNLISVTSVPPPLSLSAVQTGDAYSYQKMADLLDHRNAWVSMAYDTLRLSGTPGQSSYTASEVPLEVKLPYGNGQQFIFRADQVNINAGTVDLGNTYQAGTFGSLKLCQPNCPTNLLYQNAVGTAYNLGLQDRDLRVDGGVTPVGFLVQNWVGGIKQKGDLGAFGWTIDVSRRPVTSTLLSYAGTRDPRTGAVWGGVMSSGINLGLSLDKGEEFGGWSTLNVRSLTGMNVQSNSSTQFLAGLNWRLINESDRLLRSGLSVMYWGFARNAGEFTFGQGGYYSPQSYQSITLPLSYARRSARYSYMLSGSVSSSWSRTAAAPYYPTDIGMQTAAGNPYYSESSGPGTAYSLQAAAEYQINSSVFLGARGRVERSPFYTPNSLVVYFRIAFDGPAAEPVLLQSQPVIPTSRY